MHRTFCAITTLALGCAKPTSLPATAPLAPDRTGVSQPVHVSPLDDRDYRIVRLDNGLTAMLVSDPDTTTTAAALTVEVGSFDEPDDRPGLAHFLEHMLFLGTQTYPSPAGFDLHLARHGGESNAWTGDHLTQYQFTVAPSGFDKALHRFSRFFIDPALHEKYVQKERRAVESEYRLKVQERWDRWVAAIGQTVHPDHPASRFATGSMETLADHKQDKVVDDLRTFHSTWYTADRMHLAVVGSHPLDVLEGQVRTWFAEIPTATSPMAPRTYGPQFRDDQLGVRIDIDQLEDIHTLSLEWPIPEQSGEWPDDPTMLLSHVLGDEGPGSLFAQLVERNWVTSLSASNNDGLGPGGDLLAIDMDVTDEGVEHTDEIIAACFAAIQTLRDTPMPDYLAPELVALNELEFTYASPRYPGELSEWLSETMTEHPPERVLEASRTRPVVDPEATSDLLDLLTVDRVRIIVEGKGLEEETGREPYYDVAYRVRPLSEQERARFTAGSEVAVLLPTANPWVPTNTRMRTEQTAEQPTRLSLTEDEAAGTEIWTTPAAIWRTPKTDTTLTFYLSQTGIDTPSDYLKSLVYTSLLNRHLVDFAYPVTLAGSKYRLHIRPSAFRLSVSGWTDVQQELIDQVLAETRRFEPAEADFDTFKEDLLRKWRNKLQGRPADLLTQIPFTAINPEAAQRSEWIELLEALTYDELVAFAEGYWQRPASLRAQVYGNVDDALARQLAQTAAEHLEVAYTTDHHDYERLRWLPDGVERTLELELDHDDSGISILYLGPSGIEHSARWVLLGEMIGAPFFHELRTRQQLGYVVDAQGIYSRRAPGLQVTIQSSVAGPSVLLKQTDAFLKRSPRTLAKFSPEEFAALRQFIVDSYRQPPTTFAEGSQQAGYAVVWGEGSDEYYAALADAVEQVTREEVVALAESLFNTGAPTRIVSWSVGRAHPDDPLKGTAECADRSCLAEGMQVMFEMDFAQPGPADGTASR